MDPTEVAQRTQRLLRIAEEMNRIVMEIGPAWIRLGHLREEARGIQEELRGHAGTRD